MIIPGALMGVTDYVYVAGVAANPDSITAVLYRWVGATRSASGITVTCTSVGSGEYKFTWTNDSGFARTDELELVALPVVDSVTYPATVWRSHGDVSAVLPTAAADAAGGLPISDAGGLDLDAKLATPTSSLALAATALSTATWTNELAVNIGTTNSTVTTNLDIAISVIQAQIAALNNLSAKANWFGSALLEVPDSNTRAYIYELVVRDDEDKLTNLDALPTIALTNAAGTDRSALITTGVANPSTGRYTITITVGTSTNNESLKLTATGSVSAETRYAVMGLQVVDYDNATQVALILTRLGTPVVSVSADIAAAQTDLDTLTAGVTLTSAGVRAIWTDDWFQVAFSADTPGGRIQRIGTETDAILDDTNELQIDWAIGGRLDLILDDRASQTSVTAIQTVLTGITSLANWLRRGFRKDTGTAGMATAESEIKTGGTATFVGTTDNLEAIKDASGGSGSGSATIENQELILEAIDSLGADQLAAIEVDAGVISGFPETLTIGDSYTADTGQIKIVITDAEGDPLTSFGSLDIADADIEFKAFRPSDSAIIVGECEFVDNTPTEAYVLLTLYSSETAKGKAEFTYEGRLKFIWYGASSSDTDDDVQKTYKTTPFKFLANP